jgi:hypothetical protein
VDERLSSGIGRKSGAQKESCREVRQIFSEELKRVRNAEQVDFAYSNWLVFDFNLGEGRTVLMSSRSQFQPFALNGKAEIPVISTFREFSKRGSYPEGHSVPVLRAQ